MTRKFTFLMTAMALIFAIIGPRNVAWGQTSASIELCTSWDKTLAYATAYTQDYTIDDLNDGTTTLTLGVQGVYRQAKADTYFQMNKKTGYFKNTTKMPGKITKIETTWNNAKGATKCYFATNAAASSNDETVTVTAATSVTYTPPTDADYYYFNIDVSTGSGSAQMTSCVVYYENSTTPSKTLESIAISGTPTKTTYEAGESFDPAGLVVTGTYDDESQETITSGITWNVTPNTLTAGTTSVSVTATVSGITSTAYQVNGLTVTEFVQTYANTYTSDASLSSVITGSKVKWEGCKETDGYNALKIAKGGTANVTVPAGIETVHLHMVAWNGESSGVTVKLGETTLSTITPTADAGVSGSGTTYTIATEPKTENSYYFAIDVNTDEVTTLSLTTGSNKRAILFGVNFEAAQPSTEPNITVEETLNIAHEGTGGKEAILEVAYQNIDFENIEINLYKDAVCEEDFTDNWFIANFDADHNIEYIAEANTATAERTVYMEIYALGTDGEHDVTKVIAVTQAGVPQTYTVTLSSNGVENSQNVQGSITLVEPSNVPTGFQFAGWTESESDIRFVANLYTPTSNVTLYAVFSRVEGGTQGAGDYVKITSTPTDWSGEYLIVYEGDYEHDAVAFDGSLETLDAVENGISVSIENGIIAANVELVNSEFTIAALEDEGYSIMNKSGLFIGRTSTGNGLNTSETAIQNSLGISQNAMSISSGSCTLQYNYASNQLRFRYYTSLNQQPIQLYKKATGTPGTTHYYTRVYDENTTLESLVVSGPSIILSGCKLTANILKSENAANLVIEDGGQLVYYNDEDESFDYIVAATFQKNITGYTSTNDNYYLIAAPIADASIEGLTTNEYDLFSYDEPTHYWFNQKGTDNPFNTLSLGQGYLYANSTTGNVTISGIISNEQDPTIAVTASASNLTGFNLVGNPFTYNLNIDNMAMMDNTVTSIYQIVGTAIVASQNTSIAPCEGFFIQAPAAGELFFNAESSRSEKSPVSDLKVEVKEATRSAQLIDRAYVNFSESRPMNKFYLNENSTRLYIPQNGEDYAVVMASAAEGELPMNFKAEKNGSYTITVNTENIDAQYLHLIDNMTGMDTDLLSTPSYTFEAKTSDYASRFKLVFNVKNEEANGSSDNNFAFMSDGNLVISNIEGEATLQIVDQLGRVLSTETVSGSYNKALNLKAGLYILNLNGMTQKIVVK